MLDRSLALTLSAAAAIAAPRAAAGIEWRLLADGDERILFTAPGLGQGAFRKALFVKPPMEAEIELGEWRTIAAEAKAVLDVTGPNTYVRPQDPGEYASKVLGKSLDWGPKRWTRNQLGSVAYRLSSSRLCIAFDMVFGSIHETSLPSTHLAGYYCAASEIEPEQILRCVGVRHIGEPTCPAAATAPRSDRPPDDQAPGAGDPATQFQRYLQAASDGEGLRWLCLSADQGYAEAQFALAALYAGLASPVDHDLVRAYKWYALAARNGAPYGAAYMERIAAKMTPEQIAAARQSIADRKPGGCWEEVMSAAATGDG